jgi:glycine/D-amino acid oxidase-like deaminating enzyme
MNVGIIGGGVFGIAAAIELRARGHAITVFEQGRVPNERASSTDLSKSIRRIYDTRPTYTELAERAEVQWVKWQEQLGGSFYFPIGILQISRHFHEGTSLYSGVQYLLNRGTRIDVMAGRECRQRFPQFNYNDDDTCIWDSWGGYLASGEAVAAMAGLARAHGVDIRENSPVLSVEEKNTGVEVVIASGPVRVERAVVAAGVWIDRLIPEIGRKVAVTRQQMAFFDPVDPTAFLALPTWVVDGEDEGWYGHPIKRYGWVKVSNDLRGEIVDPDAHRNATPDFLEQARDFVMRRMPGLASAKLVGSKSCFYGNTPDHDFAIDWAPGRSRILVAGGGSGHGFKFGGSIGPVIADALEEKANPLGDRFRLGQRFSKD